LIELENIFPINHPDKKEYLVDITHKISKFVLNYYKAELDPSISYSTGKVTIDFFNKRKIRVWAYA